jgi:serine/threonine protein kinase/formylglycine-generating enzyme required for sulfatase activity
VTRENETTGFQAATDGFVVADAASDLPVAVGRYRIERMLGQGGFGCVYQARDTQLDRAVAIKVPHPHRLLKPEGAAPYVKEARMVAGLDHPHIVPVFDVGETPEFPCFIVSKLIEGTNLAEAIREFRYNHDEAADLVSTVAEALHYAHRQGLVHRDIKPGNILIDSTGKPYVVDFGLALSEQEFRAEGSAAGTPAYMSPEQASGEGHRVDGRSDIFSLGVVLYELLAGRRPFRGETRSSLLNEIATRDPKPPRQIEDRIPAELERICLKALSRRATERYTTARDFAADLKYFLSHKSKEQLSSNRPTAIGDAPPDHDPQLAEVTSTMPSAVVGRPVVIVPKGLRSFDRHDADFFLELLPGPRDRDGLPESIRLWKSRIEESDPDKTFAVGLIYGPSGCGKTSLVKAGLVPRLSSNVITVYTEATPGETEIRLLNGVRRHCPAAPGNLSLKETLAAVRCGSCDTKLLIVLDQFEQWLHAGNRIENSELVQALRQCDGVHVQCLVMARDDFWMATTRFMRELEISLQEGQNSAAVDLFDVDHAHTVLRAFGRAFGRISGDGVGASKDQQEFLNKAVAGLAQDGKVVSVRLALFAEMMKGKPWTPAALRDVGGAQGVGLAFLEETFSAAHAPPRHRWHVSAVRGVLKELLPQSGGQIKGHMRSYAELLAASGYGDRTRDFDDVIRLLDGEVRLITPTDPEGPVIDDGLSTTVVTNQKYFQLTHDYLVHSIRDWLSRKQRETRRGRAELRLAELSDDWNKRPRPQLLPTLFEWVNLRLLTNPRKWSGGARQMMRAAARRHIVRAVGGVIVLVALAVVWRSMSDRARERERLLDAEREVSRTLVVDTSRLRDRLPALEPLRDVIDPLFRQVLNRAEVGSKEQLHASLALLPRDPAQAQLLRWRLLAAQPAELKVIRESLEREAPNLSDFFWDVALNPREDPDRRLRAACFLAACDLDEDKWGRMARDVISQLISEDPFRVGQWAELLRPARKKLEPVLRLVFAATGWGEQRYMASGVLAEYISDDLDELWILLESADERQVGIVIPHLHQHREQAVARLESEMTQSVSKDQSDNQRNERSRFQAKVVLALFSLGTERPLWEMLRESPDPRGSAYLTRMIPGAHWPPGPFVAHLEHEDADGATRKAILEILAAYPETSLFPGQRMAFLPQLLEIYQHDPDPGVHSASELLLRRWEFHAERSEVDEQLPNGPQAERRWFLAPEGHVFVIAGGPVVAEMGSDVTEIGREAGEHRHRQTIPRRFAVATKEVTVRQFQRFRAEHPYNRQNSPDAECPMNEVTWYDAVRYCRWLSDQDQELPEEEKCYPPINQIEQGFVIDPAQLSRTGYRLPTEAEWEYACRSGTVTAHYFGTDTSLIADYAWTADIPPERSRPVGRLLPNRWGLFDTLGNVYEWCLDQRHAYPSNPDTTLSADFDEHGLVQGHQIRVVRGGAFHRTAEASRAAFRNVNGSDTPNSLIGFRIVRTVR